jgi:hypothetical protein
MKPQLLGYIFDVLAYVLQVVDKGGIRLDLKSRMADFEYAEIISRYALVMRQEYLSMHITRIRSFRPRQ